MPNLGIIFFPAFDWAISPTHPEREERLLYTRDQLREEGIFDLENIHEFKPEIAADTDIQRTHFCIPSVSEVTTESHRIAAGGALQAARLVMEKSVDKAFAMVRPPGHHAMKVVHGNRGFCSINNEAVMIEMLRREYGIRKIAIVDTDCHHGDGTQDIYWHDPDVLFISMHQDGRTIFPGTGFLPESGGPNARGRTINIPLPPGAADDDALRVMETIILPLLEMFQPEIIINSAGQDNHFSDPITDMNLTAQGYAKLNDMLNPDIAVLEGGYAIEGALPYVNLGIVLAMAGLDYSGLREPNYAERPKYQDLRIRSHIEHIRDPILAAYQSGPQADKKPGSIETRDKRIFYDTDGFLEHQSEQICICDQCRGAMKIISKTDHHPETICVDIPIGICSRCLETAETWIETARHENEKTLKIIYPEP